MKILNKIKNRLLDWWLKDRIEVYYDQQVIGEFEIIRRGKDLPKFIKFVSNELAREIGQKLLNDKMITIERVTKIGFGGEIIRLKLKVIKPTNP